MALRVPESYFIHTVFCNSEISKKTERECFTFVIYKGTPSRIGIILESENISKSSSGQNEVGGLWQGKWDSREANYYLVINSSWILLNEIARK
jgi:hypothetical protein